MANLDIGELTKKLAGELTNNSDLLEKFKEKPHEVVGNSTKEEVSHSDITKIIGNLLDGAHDGGGMLGGVKDSLTAGTKSGGDNVIGDLMKNISGGKGDASDMIGNLVHGLLGSDADGKGAKGEKKDDAKDGILGNVMEAIEGKGDIGDLIGGILGKK